MVYNTVLWIPGLKAGTDTVTVFWLLKIWGGMVISCNFNSGRGSDGYAAYPKKLQRKNLLAQLKSFLDLQRDWCLLSQIPNYFSSLDPAKKKGQFITKVAYYWILSNLQIDNIFFFSLRETCFIILKVMLDSSILHTYKIYLLTWTVYVWDKKRVVYNKGCVLLNPPKLAN